MQALKAKQRQRRRERHFDNRVVWCFKDRADSVYAGFAQAAQAHPQAQALVFGQRSWTYAELAAEAGRIAAGLQQLGVLPGDRVALLLRNRAEFVTVFLAIQRLGAVAVPMDVRLQGVEVGHVLADAGARLLLHDEALADRLPAAAALSADTVQLAVPEHQPLFGDALAPPVQAVAEEDTALILYTSGTTGKPKGAMLSHLNVAHSVIHHAGHLDLGAADRCVIAVPLSHVTGLLCGVIATLSVGGTLVLLPHFKAREFLPAAAAAGMTYTIMVPAMYKLCLLVPDFDWRQLSCWRIGHFGGAPMPEATIAALADKLPGLDLVNGYGATETCSPAVTMPLGEGAAHRDAVGKPLACVEVMVVDPDTGIEQPTGQPGELWIRGPMVATGYWRNAAATQAAFVAGFWRSGDLGHLDADGYVHVHDRLKDVINRGGYKIYSAEVESVLADCPGVVEAAIVGKPDPVLGERVHAFVTVAHTLAAEAVPLTGARLSAFCAQRLGDYKVPESWSLSTEPLPRNANGKLSKQVLRLQLADPTPALTLETH